MIRGRHKIVEHRHARAGTAIDRVGLVVASSRLVSASHGTTGNHHVTVGAGRSGRRGSSGMRAGTHGRAGVRDVGRTVVRSAGGTLHRLLRSHTGSEATSLGHLRLRHRCHAGTSRLRHRGRSGALSAHARLRTGRLHGALLLSRSTKRGRGGGSRTAGHVLGKLRAAL